MSIISGRAAGSNWRTAPTFIGTDPRSVASTVRSIGVSRGKGAGLKRAALESRVALGSDGKVFTPARLEPSRGHVSPSSVPTFPARMQGESGEDDCRHAENCLQRTGP